MNWASSTEQDAKRAAANRRFFHELHQAFVAAYPARARRDFALYQRVAQQIIAAATKEGPAAVKIAQDYIYAHLVKPTGAHLEAKEIAGAVRAMIAAVKALAARFKVPLPANASEIEATYAGSAPAPAASPAPPSPQARPRFTPIPMVR